MKLKMKTQYFMFCFYHLIRIIFILKLINSIVLYSKMLLNIMSLPLFYIEAQTQRVLMAAACSV